MTAPFFPSFMGVFEEELLDTAVADGTVPPPPTPLGFMEAPFDAFTPQQEPSDRAPAPVAPAPDARVAGNIRRRQGSRVTKTPRKTRRGAKDGRSTPRCERVWRTCHACGRQNHVRRLFCSFCFESRRR